MAAPENLSDLAELTEDSIIDALEKRYRDKSIYVSRNDRGPPRSQEALQVPLVERQRDFLTERDQKNRGRKSEREQEPVDVHGPQQADTHTQPSHALSSSALHC